MESRKVKTKSTVLLSSENDTKSQREKELGFKLKELSIDSNCADESKLAGYSKESKNTKIVVLDETSNQNDSDSTDDEDVPPPITFQMVKNEGRSATTTAATATTTEISRGPSLMEEMMKEGGSSIKKKQNEQKKMEQKKAATAFGGFQKGFLSPSKTKRIKKKRPDSTNQKSSEVRTAIILNYNASQLHLAVPDFAFFLNIVESFFKY